VCKRLPEVVHDETRRDQKPKLGSELPVFNDVWVPCPPLGPWFDDGVADETHESLNGKEDEKAKEDIVKRFHLFTKHQDYTSTAHDTSDAAKHVVARTRLLGVPSTRKPADNT